MLRHSSQALPAEVYDMIYAHLSLNHLAAIQKTCRLLFRVTCPYVWRSVYIESLLQLLPGCTKVTGKVPRLEITTPSPIPLDYFIRFFHYARFVKCMKITPQFTISGSFEEDLSEVAILASTTGHLILPHLRTVHLTILEDQQHFYDEYTDYKFWMDALIPNSIQHVSFEAVWTENESLLDALLSKAPELARLEFAPGPEEQSPSFYKQVVGPEKMHNVRFLRYTGSIMDPQVLLWIGEMRQLTILELLIDPGDSDSEEPLSLPEVTFPSDSFQALNTLKVFTSDHGDIIAECDLLKQLWRTPVVRYLTTVEIKFSSPPYPDMKEFDQFMTILSAHSPNVSSLRLEASGQPKHFPEITVELLSGVRRLPLHTLSVQSPFYTGANQLLFKNLGGTFAKLEVLDLGSTTVEIPDILSAHSYLPSLRYINIGVWQTKVSRKALKRTVFFARLDHVACTALPPSGSSLSLCFRERKSVPKMCAYNLDFHDVDLIAILLAAQWANIHVHGDLLPDRMGFLQTQLDHWRCRAEQNWEAMVDKVLLLSVRNCRW